MHPDRGFQRRLGAESFRFLQQHPRVQHLQVVLLVPHRRLKLGDDQPELLKRFLLQDVIWVDLAELSQVEEPDLRLALLTLPVRPEAALVPCCRRILALRPELLELILPRLGERFAGLTNEEIMATIGISRDSWRHTRAFQEILEEGLQTGLQTGRQEGRGEGSCGKPPASACACFTIPGSPRSGHHGPHRATGAGAAGGSEPQSAGFQRGGRPAALAGAAASLTRSGPRNPPRQSSATGCADRSRAGRKAQGVHPIGRATRQGSCQ